METATVINMINNNCSNCENISAPVANKCYPWVEDEFLGRNYTLDDVNSVVMRRNYAGITFLGIVIVLGLIGNGHVLYVFSKRTYKSNSIKDSIHVNYRIFILWLSVLGVIQCAVVSPLLIVYLVYPVTYPSNVLCKIFRFIVYFVPEAISLTLIAIAIDRYLVICRTFENKLTEKHSKLMCLATMIVSLVFSWPAPIVFGNGETETGIPGLTGHRCYLEDESITKIQQLYQVILVMFFFVILFVLLILYTKVRRDYKELLQFRRTSRRYSTTTPKAFKQRLENQEQQRVWIYASVTIGYVVSALPYHILAILFFAGVIVDCDMSLPESELFYLFIWSYFFSPVINPIFYGFQDDGFRLSVLAIYKRSKKSVRLRLYDRKSSNGHISNGNEDFDKSRELSKSGSQILTELSTEDDFCADIKPQSELKNIMRNIAAFTVDSSTVILEEDENKNSVHI
ncbi:neuropeptide Y receptor type 6-like [Mytilus trossulus]|uniref:neuropeptide Y receptor type 6-like n=1 Tax=Mytilus trossulus TaxID=6551 RepID=UPI003006ADD4